MTENTQQEKFRFFRNWTLTGSGIVPLSYILSLVAVILVHGAFGFGETDPGTHLSQTLMQIAGGAVIGLGTGLYQKLLLQKICNITSCWIYFLVIGFVLTELVICLILWQLDMDRYKLRFIERNPLPEALIFASAGLVTGLLQWTLLRKHFIRSGYWIIASAAGWGICILINYLWFVPWIGNSVIASVIVFALGSLLYGAITGATLMWVLQPISQDNNKIL